MSEELDLKKFKTLKYINKYFDSKTNSLFYIYTLKLLEKVKLKEGVDYEFFFENTYFKKKNHVNLVKYFIVRIKD